MQKTIIKLFVFSACLTGAAESFAQDDFGFSKKLGDSDFYPAVRLEYVSDSNIFLDSDNETESANFRVTPQLLFNAQNGQISIEAEYKGEYNNSDVSAGSYADHSLRFETTAELSKRFRTGASLALLSEHQDLGTRLTRGIADENTDAVEFNQTGFNVFGTYGAAQARGNISFGLTLDALNFTNQAALTDGQNYLSVEPYGVFSLRVSPDLRALAELRLASTSYDNRLLDRSEATVLFGVDISTTRKLSGQIKVGGTLTEYDNDSLRDTSQLTIRTGLNYKPVEYSAFSLVLSRGTDRLSDNAATVDQASITDVLRLGWRHNWSSRVFHRAGLTRRARTEDCPTGDLITNTASYELNLNVRRWLEFGLGGSGSSRDAKSCDGTNVSDDDFTRTRVGVHIRATL